MDWQNILGIAGVIIAVGSVAGLGLLRDRLSVLKDSNSELRERVADLEHDRTEDRAQLAEVKAENKTLKAMVTGKVEWTAISDQLEEHHRQALASWSRIEGSLATIHNDLTREV